jgi:hypothetical protein
VNGRRGFAAVGAPIFKEERKPVNPPEEEWWVEKREVGGLVT